MHAARLVSEKIKLDFLHQLLIRRLGKQLQQTVVLRQAAVSTQELNTRIVGLPSSQKLLRLCDDLRNIIPLGGDNTLDPRFHLCIPLVFRLHWPADDERRSRFVDED
jgi:hypothetical protein